jgi:uncharacterized membrane protein YeaQ/YmgE (transglycosylase-associated protein family)
MAVQYVSMFLVGLIVGIVARWVYPARAHGW